jgi:mitogen-activated protein kinase organizer 1
MSVSEGGREESALQIKSYAGIHGYGILDVAVSHDNEWFASSGHDKSIFVCDVSSGKVTRKLQGHQQRVNALALNDDSTVLASASYDQKVHLWDMRTQNRIPLQTLADCKDSATSVAMSGAAIVVGCVDGVLRTYDMRKGLLHEDSLVDSIVSVRLSHDRTHTLSLCLGKTQADGNIYKTSTLRAPAEVAGLWRHSGNCCFKSEAIFCNEKGRGGGGGVVVSGGEHGQLRWWAHPHSGDNYNPQHPHPEGSENSSTGGPQTETEGTGSPNTTADSGGGGSSSSRLGTMLWEHPKAHAAAVSSLSHHPSLPLLLSAGYERDFYLWRVQY